MATGMHYLGLLGAIFLLVITWLIIRRKVKGGITVIKKENVTLPEEKRQTEESPREGDRSGRGDRGGDSRGTTDRTTDGDRINERTIAVRSGEPPKPFVSDFGEGESEGRDDLPLPETTSIEGNKRKFRFRRRRIKRSK